MPVTMSIVGGDGINAPAIRMNIQLPDTGTSVPVQGTYVATAAAGTQPGTQQVPINFSGTQTQTYTSGYYWMLELGVTVGGTGAALAGTLTSKFGATMPTQDSGTFVLFTQLMPATSTISQQGGFTFPSLATVPPN